MLTEVDFYCALKFVAIAQHGHAMQEDNLKMETPMPKFNGTY